MKFAANLKSLCILILCLFGSALHAAESLPTSEVSPDWKLELSLSANRDGPLSWSFKADGREWIKPSPAGLASGAVRKLDLRSVGSVWKPVSPV